MYDEILEYLDYLGNLQLALLPYAKTLNHNIVNKPIFDICEMDDGGYSVECNLLNFRIEIEAILQADVFIENETYKLALPLFKS